MMETGFITFKHNFLDINNAMEYFIKHFSQKECERLKGISLLNSGRYAIIHWNDRKSVFYKFTREHYLKGKYGASDTINRQEVIRLVALHQVGKLDFLYFGLADGRVYFINIMDFLEKSYLEIEKGNEQKEKYVIALKDLKRYE
jgi:hypothetical protein